MRILIIVPNISQSGGTERAATNLANMLGDAGYTIILVSVSSSEDEIPYYKINQFIKIFHLGLPPTPIGVLEKFRWFPSAVRILRKKTSEIAPDLIFGEGHNINAMLPFVRNNKNVPIVGCEHIVFMSIPLSSRLIMKILYTYLNRLVVLSVQAKVAMRELTTNISVIPNTLPFLTKRVSDLNSTRILMVGRLSREKGYDRLVPIVKILKTKYPDWHIDIFGEGSIKSELIALYKEEGIDDYITIHLPNKIIQNEYLKSSIYLMTSYTEAMPMVLLEAKSCGLPVIGYECEGTSELINNNVDGFLVEDGNVLNMVNKISVLIEDKELRNQIGNNARISAIAYTPENIINKWKQLIGEINSN